MSPIVLRITGQHKIKFRRRAVKVAFFVVDQADLDPCLPRVRFGALNPLELAQSFIQFILADVELAQPFPRPDAFRH